MNINDFHEFQNLKLNDVSGELILESSDLELANGFDRKAHSISKSPSHFLTSTLTDLAHSEILKNPNQLPAREEDIDIEYQEILSIIGVNQVPNARAGTIIAEQHKGWKRIFDNEKYFAGLTDSKAIKEYMETLQSSNEEFNIVFDNQIVRSFDFSHRDPIFELKQPRPQVGTNSNCMCCQDELKSKAVVCQFCGY